MRSERPEPTDAASGHEVFAFVADRGDAGIRLDLAILRHLRGRVQMSRQRIQESIDEGQVRVNGAVAGKPAVRVAAGNRVEISLVAPRARLVPQPEMVPLDVLYEDDDLLAVNKPPGVVMHPAYKHASGTLFNAMLWHLRDTGVHPRLLQRLDKDTSGVVLVSKTLTAHQRIACAMRSAGGVRVASPGVATAPIVAQGPIPAPVVAQGLSPVKEYLAVVDGVPRRRSGTIELGLERNSTDTRRVAVSVRGGKPSITRYEVLARRRRVSLLRCTLVTGRMHQIRVHLAASGWPIIGDRVYTGLKPCATSARTPSPGLSRQALHAWRVSLAHPITGVRLVIVAPIPADMQDLLARCGWTVPSA